MSNSLEEARLRRKFLDALNHSRAAELVRFLKKDPTLGRVVWLNGATGLMIAADNGSLSCVRALLSCSVHTQLDDRGCTALMIAAAGGHAECVRELLNAHAHNMQAVDHEGRSALHLAALEGSQECVRELLHSSDANALDLQGCSAMELAAQGGYMGCADALADSVSMEVLERVLAAQPDPQRLPRAWALFERHQLQSIPTQRQRHTAGRNELSSPTPTCPTAKPSRIQNAVPTGNPMRGKNRL